MKKLKVVLLSIISILFVYFIVEFTTYTINSNILVKAGYKFFNNEDTPIYPTNIKLFSNFYEKNYKNSVMSDNAGLSYKNRPIILFGDSFADISYLSADSNFTSILSKYAKRPVFNFAEPGWDIQHMYFLLKNEEYLSVIKNPISIIYVYNDYQRERMNSFSFYAHHPFLMLRYAVEDEKIVEKIPSALFLYNSYFYRILEKTFGIIKSKSTNPNVVYENINLVKHLFVKSKEISDVKYCGLKDFVILRFVSEDRTLEFLNNDESAAAQLEYNMWKQLEAEGFKIIDVQMLTDKSLSRNADSSPTEETLDEIIPRLLDKVKI